MSAASCNLMPLIITQHTSDGLSYWPGVPSPSFLISSLLIPPPLKGSGCRLHSDEMLWKIMGLIKPESILYIWIFYKRDFLVLEPEMMWESPFPATPEFSKNLDGQVSQQKRKTFINWGWNVIKHPSSSLWKKFASILLHDWEPGKE